jgi:3-hydroxybutyrate dehydrogenase
MSPGPGTPAALVTGGAGGLGQAVIERLLAEGFAVLNVDLEPRGAGVHHVADLTTREGNEGAVARAVAEFGRLDVVVANAGVQHVAPVEDFPDDRWEAMIALMLTSPFRLARAAWPHLRACGHGRFLVVASAHSLVASPFKAAYVAAKHGALGLIRTLALEGAEDRIAAVAVCPGFADTPLVERQLPDLARSHGVSQDEALRHVVLSPHAIKRLVRPEEVASVVALLTGPIGETFTGTHLDMDLGWTAR